MNIDKLIYNIALSLKPKDILQRIEYEVKLEEIFNDIREKDVLDTELFIDVTFLKIPFLNYLMEFKDISSDEARSLIAYGYVTYNDFIRILEFGIK